MTHYEKRIRERFPALASHKLWPTIKRLVDEDWQSDHDEFWFDRVQQHCIDTCEALGLPIGPAKCNDEHWFPARGNKPDGGDCSVCRQEKRAREDEEAARRQRWDAMTPEERALEPKLILTGLIARRAVSVKPGDVFGRLTVKSATIPGSILCRCACGRLVQTSQERLEGGAVRSCGCDRLPEKPKSAGKKQFSWAGSKGAR